MAKCDTAQSPLCERAQADSDTRTRGRAERGTERSRIANRVCGVCERPLPAAAPRASAAASRRGLLSPPRRRCPAPPVGHLWLAHLPRPVESSRSLALSHSRSHEVCVFDSAARERRLIRHREHRQSVPVQTCGLLLCDFAPLHLHPSPRLALSSSPSSHRRRRRRRRRISPPISTPPRAPCLLLQRRRGGAQVRASRPQLRFFSHTHTLSSLVPGSAPSSAAAAATEREHPHPAARPARILSARLRRVVVTLWRPL